MKILYIFIFCLFLLLLLGCEITTFSTTGNDFSPPIVTEGEKIFITDRTGKQWDITYAVRVYKFDSTGFQFGSGPYAIKLILNPKMLSPGDPGYPSPQVSSQIIGTTINADTRAYPLDALDLREIANDSFGDTHVAVAF